MLMITVLSKVNKTQGHMQDIVSLVCGKEQTAAGQCGEKAGRTENSKHSQEEGNLNQQHRRGTVGESVCDTTQDWQHRIAIT